MKQMIKITQQGLKQIALGAIIAYQWLLSPFFGGACRFYPSCSSYAEKAIQKEGVGKGIWLSAKRILKCHPFHPGGVDDIAA